MQPDLLTERPSARWVKAAREHTSPIGRKMRAWYAAIDEVRAGYTADTVSNPFNRDKEPELHDAFAWMMRILSPSARQSPAWTDLGGA